MKIRLSLMKDHLDVYKRQAINTLNHFSKDLSQNPSKEELKAAIRDCKNELKKDKYIKYVRKTRIKEN